MPIKIDNLKLVSQTETVIQTHSRTEESLVWPRQFSRLNHELKNLESGRDSIPDSITNCIDFADSFSFKSLKKAMLCLN